MCKTEIRHSNLHDESKQLNKKGKVFEKPVLYSVKILKQVIKFTFCLSTAHWASKASFHINYVLP